MPIEVDAIPDTSGDEDDDMIDAFQEVIARLFDEYPVNERANDGNMETAAHWRREALNGRRDPQAAAYYACDTGVPNELILGAYKLIFDFDRT